MSLGIGTLPEEVCLEGKDKMRRHFCLPQNSLSHSPQASSTASEWIVASTVGDPSALQKTISKI